MIVLYNLDMRNSPTIKEIKSWLLKNNPLGLFADSIFKISNIDPKSWSGHFDYLIETKNKKFVMRFKGPEWGDPAGIIDEYNILKKVAEYNVGAKVYYLTEDFFGEPMMFQEYLEGVILCELAEAELKNEWSDIARFIAKINKIPFQKDDFLFQENMLSYVKNKDAWKTRLEFIASYEKTSDAIDEIFTSIPGVESELDRFEERLQRVIQAVGSSFIFESAHFGHCMKTKNGFRFLNWEQVSFGDPSFTLAVFLTSIKSRKDFESIKREMINAYLEINPVLEFEELLEQRMFEREVSNKIYSLWSQAKKKVNL